MGSKHTAGATAWPREGGKGQPGRRGATTHDGQAHDATTWQRTATRGWEGAAKQAWGYHKERAGTRGNHMRRRGDMGEAGTWGGVRID